MKEDIKRVTSGSRGSKLALVQVTEIEGLLEQQGIRVSFDNKTYDTKGDKDKTTPLTSNPADDFFTDALDHALLNKEVDITIHSAKDLPQETHPDLEIFALTKALDETDAFVGRKKIDYLPPEARIGTSSQLRQKFIKEKYPHLKCLDIRGNIEERIAKVRSGEYDGVIIATCALIRLGLKREITEILPWPATPLQGQLAVVGRKGDRALKQFFAGIDIRRAYGRVTLVGAGPGDPELITMKGIKALSAADCVFYDYLVSKELLNHAPRAEHIYVGKRKGAHSLPQDELSRQLKEKALAGKNVVRLKGGDPLIFGRGADEITFLSAYHIPVRIIPGVSSATAIPSLLGIPLTARGVASSVAFVSGHGEAEKGEAPRPVKIPDVDTIVFLMGLTKLPLIVESLKSAGWRAEAPVIVISKGTTPDEHIVSGTLADIETKVHQADLKPPALIVAGDIVKFWKPKKMKEEKILFTGTNPQHYQQLGSVVHHPMIMIEPAKDHQDEIKSALQRLSEFAVILFTSRYAVQYFFKALDGHNIDRALIKDKTFAVIGRVTRDELRAAGYQPRIIADIETGEGMFQAFKAYGDLTGTKILFPRSVLPNPYLKKALAALGADVTEITVYNNVKPDKRDLALEQFDKVMFTSPSTVRNFLADYGGIPAYLQVISKGPKTAQALKEAGYRQHIQLIDE